MAQGRTVDDTPSVAPYNAKDSLITFVKQYRNSLEALNIKAAKDDPSCTKAFDCSQEGEVLGIRFNTNSFTWSLPHSKLTPLVTDLRRLASGEDTHFSLRELERIVGKLIHVSQLCLPLTTFTTKAVFMMREQIWKLLDIQGNISDEDRDRCAFLVPQDVHQDLLMVAMLMADTYDHPLPIVDPEPLSHTLLHTYTPKLVGT